jgi:hypothetical protein
LDNPGGVPVNDGLSSFGKVCHHVSDPITEFKKCKFSSNKNHIKNDMFHFKDGNKGNESIGDAD